MQPQSLDLDLVTVVSIDIELADAEQPVGQRAERLLAGHKVRWAPIKASASLSANGQWVRYENGAFLQTSVDPEDRSRMDFDRKGRSIITCNGAGIDITPKAWSQIKGGSASRYTNHTDRVVWWFSP